MSATLYCSFWLDEVLFGIEAGRVQEVMRGYPLTPVPLAADAFCGLLNLRGQIVSALDIRKPLGLPAAGAGVTPVHVVVRTGHGIISLLVDDISDVVDTTGLSWEPPPETLAKRARDVILGTFAFPERLLLVLDIDRLVAMAAPERTT